MVKKNQRMIRIKHKNFKINHKRACSLKIKLRKNPKVATEWSKQGSENPRWESGDVGGHILHMWLGQGWGSSVRVRALSIPPAPTYKMLVEDARYPLNTYTHLLLNKFSISFPQFSQRERVMPIILLTYVVERLQSGLKFLVNLVSLDYDG